MEHVVFFPAPDGGTAFRRVGSLEDAAGLVEHLRNVDGVAEVAVHPLGTEVPLAFRTWYRVELPSADPASQQPPETPVEARVEGLAEAPVDAPAPAQESPSARTAVPQQSAGPAHEAAGAGDGPKSLGFFAT